MNFLSSCLRRDEVLRFRQKAVVSCCGMGARTLGQEGALAPLDFEYIYAQLIFKKHFK